MKKLTLALAVSAIATSSAYAGTTSVYGNLGNWKSWNAASKAPMPYFVAAAGVDLVQANNAGDSIGTGSLNIAVTGTATYNDVTGAITSLSLSQIGLSKAHPNRNSCVQFFCLNNAVVSSGLSTRSTGRA